MNAGFLGVGASPAEAHAPRPAIGWAIVLRPSAGHAGPRGAAAGTRVHLRLRLAGVKRRRLVEIGGGLFDLLTIAGLAAGLSERLGPARR